MADPVRVQREESFQTSGPPATLVVGYVNPDDLARAMRGAVDARLRELCAVAPGELRTLIDWLAGAASSGEAAAPREPAQERQEAPEPPQHAEAMADLLRELEGWKDGPNTSDDTRRKHWLMRRAAATIRQLRRDARDPVEGCRMYYNGLNMADQIIQCYPTDLAKAQAGIRDAMKREREQIDRLTAHWRGPVGIQATQAQNESSPLPTGTPPTPTPDPLLPGLRAAEAEYERLCADPHLSQRDVDARFAEWIKAEIARREGKR